LDINNRKDLLSEILINTTLPDPSFIDPAKVYFDFNFKVKALAHGGAESWKKVQTRIVVCGNETLFLNSSGPMIRRLFTNESDVFTNISMPALFRSSDQYCQAVDFTLTNKTGNPYRVTPPLESDMENFWIRTDSKTELSLQPNVEGTYRFFILAKSVTYKYKYKEFILDIIGNSTVETLPAVPAATEPPPVQVPPTTVITEAEEEALPPATVITTIEPVEPSSTIEEPEVVLKEIKPPDVVTASPK
jgi:hypothetical protein